MRLTFDCVVFKKEKRVNRFVEIEKIIVIVSRRRENDSSYDSLRLIIDIYIASGM
jgi:hypothetical protein